MGRMSRRVSSETVRVREEPALAEEDQEEPGEEEAGEAEEEEEGEETLRTQPPRDKGPVCPSFQPLVKKAKSTRRISRPLHQEVCRHSPPPRGWMVWRTFPTVKSRRRT